MKRLVRNTVPITSNYEEITLWEEIIKISNDDTITGENLLALKTNIEMRLGNKLQEIWWDLGKGENKIVIFKLEMPTSRCIIITQFQQPGTQQRTQNIISTYLMSTVTLQSPRWF
jgi:hypothetical protein